MRLKMEIGMLEAASYDLWKQVVQDAEEDEVPVVCLRYPGVAGPFTLIHVDHISTFIKEIQKDAV